MIRRIATARRDPAIEKEVAVEGAALRLPIELVAAVGVAATVNRATVTIGVDAVGKTVGVTTATLDKAAHLRAATIGFRCPMLDGLGCLRFSFDGLFRCCISRYRGQQYSRSRHNG